MTTVTNPYDALYTNLKNQFTVIYNGSECTVGDFMRLKAMKKSESKLPISCTYTKTKSLANIVDYVSDKLVVKNAPIKDKTIRHFPLRTSLSSLLSATAACAMILSCGIFAFANRNSADTSHTIDASHQYEEQSNEDAHTENNFYSTHQ